MADKSTITECTEYAQWQQSYRRYYYFKHANLAKLIMQQLMNGGQNERGKQERRKADCREIIKTSTFNCTLMADFWSGQMTRYIHARWIRWNVAWMYTVYSAVPWLLQSADLVSIGHIFSPYIHQLFSIWPNSRLLKTRSIADSTVRLPPNCPWSSHALCDCAPWQKGSHVMINWARIIFCSVPVSKMILFHSHYSISFSLLLNVQVQKLYYSTISTIEFIARHSSKHYVCWLSILLINLSFTLFPARVIRSSICSISQNNV